jgi:hypothetical protein
VLAIHQEVQLYGGKALDEDDIQDSVLKQSNSEFGRPLKIVAVDLTQVPSDMPIRIDPGTKRLVRPDS